MRIFASIATGVIVAALAGVSGSPVHAQSNDQEQQPKIVEEVKVVSGDTLSGIAKDHETTYVRLYNANEEIEHPDLIYPGNIVGIPHKDAELKKRELPTAQPTAQQRVEAEQAAAQPEPAPAPAPQPQPQPQPAEQPDPAPVAPSNSVWDRLAQCESSGNWSINTGNGYYGGLQFSLSSWRAVGGTGYPHQASKAEQINRAEKLQAIQGWGAWPACTEKLGIH